MKQIRRKYPSNDAYMLNISSALHQIFTESIHDFLAFDNNLDINFANEWFGKIKEAYSIAPESQLKDIQSQKTNIVNQLLSQCRTKYHEVKFFAYKAFVANDKQRAVFGNQSFTKIKRSSAAMIAFMDTLYTACIKHQAILIAEGMNQADIEAIATLRDQLAESYLESQNYRKVKRSLTHERVLLLNECYRMTRLVINAANIIYREDYARKKMYVFSAV